MKTESTPGPWTIVGQLPSGITIANNRDLVAKVYGAGEIANANLIIAAPDMLEALVNLEKAYMILIKSVGGFASDSAREARNAIAKARGES